MKISLALLGVSALAQEEASAEEATDEAVVAERNEIELTQAFWTLLGILSFLSFYTFFDIFDFFRQIC